MGVTFGAKVTGRAPYAPGLAVVGEYYIKEIKEKEEYRHMAWDDLRLRVVSRTAGISIREKGSNRLPLAIRILFITTIKDPNHPYVLLVPIPHHSYTAISSLLFPVNSLSSYIHPFNSSQKTRL